MKVTTRSVPFKAFSRPDFADSILFPADITELDSAEVSRLMGSYTEMQVWAATHAATLGMRIAETENMLEAIKSNIYGNSPSILTSLNKNEREEKLSTYPRVQKMKHQLRLLHAERSRAETYASSYERFVNVLSRELSRKTASRDGLLFEQRRGKL